MDGCGAKPVKFYGQSLKKMKIRTILDLFLSEMKFYKKAPITRMRKSKN